MIYLATRIIKKKLSTYYPRLTIEELDSKGRLEVIEIKEFTKGFNNRGEAVKWLEKQVLSASEECHNFYVRYKIDNQLIT